MQAAGRPRFQKGQSGNPRGPRCKNLSALLIAALNEPVYATIDGHRRKITKREAIVTQMVNKSAEADLRATKMLFDMMKEVDQTAGAAPPEPQKLTAPDREVVELFVARLRRQIAAEAAEAAAAAPSEVALGLDRVSGLVPGSRPERADPLRHPRVLMATVGRECSPGQDLADTRYQPQADKVMRSRRCQRQRLSRQAIPGLSTDGPSLA